MRVVWVRTNVGFNIDDYLSHSADNCVFSVINFKWDRFNIARIFVCKSG